MPTDRERALPRTGQSDMNRIIHCTCRLDATAVPERPRRIFEEQGVDSSHTAVLTNFPSRDTKRDSTGPRKGETRICLPSRGSAGIRRLPLPLRTLLFKRGTVRNHAATAFLYSEPRAAPDHFSDLQCLADTVRLLGLGLGERHGHLHGPRVWGGDAVGAAVPVRGPCRRSQERCLMSMTPTGKIGPRQIRLRPGCNLQKYLS